MIKGKLLSTCPTHQEQKMHILLRTISGEVQVCSPFKCWLAALGKCRFMHNVIIVLSILAAKTVQDLLDPAEASSSVAHHITFLCQRLDAKIRVALIENDCDVPLRDSSDSCNTLLRLICNVLNTAVSEGQHNVTIAMLVALQTLMKQVSACWAELDDSAIKEARVLLWKLVNTSADSVGTEVQLEVCNVLKAGLEVLYPSAVERSALLMLLLSEGESTPNMGPLLDLILTDLAEAIMSADPGVKKERLALQMIEYSNQMYM